MQMYGNVREEEEGGLCKYFPGFPLIRFAQKNKYICLCTALHFEAAPSIWEGSERKLFCFIFIF